MTTYTNAAGVNPAMLHVWGPFYIISVFPIILHLSFGDKLSQNRKIVWLSLFSLKIVESFPLHLRRQSIALSDSSIKKMHYPFSSCFTHKRLLFHLPNCPDYKDCLLYFKSSLIVCIVVVVVCLGFFFVLIFYFALELWILNLLKTWSMYQFLGLPQ